MWRDRFVGFCALVLSCVACGDDGDGNDAGTGAAGMGSGGMTAGSGGMTGGMGGMTGGMGGMTGGMGGMTGGMGGDPPVGAPTWSAIWRDIVIGSGCNGTTFCHAGDVGMLPMNDKDMTYMALVNQPAAGVNIDGSPNNCADTDLVRVVPGEPDMSLLVIKLEQTEPPCGTMMPPTGLLEPSEMMQVRTWILNGAENN